MQDPSKQTLPIHLFELQSASLDVEDRIYSIRSNDLCTSQMPPADREAIDRYIPGRLPQRTRQTERLRQIRARQLHSCAKRKIRFSSSSIVRPTCTSTAVDRMCSNEFEQPTRHRETACEMQRLGREQGILKAASGNRSRTGDVIRSRGSNSPAPERCNRHRRGKPDDVNVTSKKDSPFWGRNDLEGDLDISGPEQWGAADGDDRRVTPMTASNSAGSVRERQPRRGRTDHNFILPPESPTTVVFSPILQVKPTLLASRKLKSIPLAKLEEGTVDPLSVRNDEPCLRGARKRPMTSPQVDATDPTIKGTFDNGQNRAWRLGPVTRSTTMYFPSGDLSDGITLRLSTLDTFVESWDSTMAPVRALCDIDSSLNHAVINYRGFIDGVDGVGGIQQTKTYKHRKRTKRILNRGARSQVGQDVRPRTCEPRMRIAGVTAELEVLKAVTIRERMISILRRLIRRLRHHCGKLQDCLRRERIFRWRFAKSPPDVVVSAITAARVTLKTEQQELRVILAHLRAISLETVKAISHWRTTLDITEKPRYQTLEADWRARATQPLGQGFSFSSTNKARTCNDSSAGEGANEIRRQNLDGDKPLQETPYPYLSDAIQASGAEDTTSGDGHTIATPLDSYVNNRPMIFLWKGHNYLLKMSNDLDFLDDATVSSPVSGWLGFHVRGNPFLVPPVGHDACEALQREHDKRLEEISTRRQQHHCKHPHRHQHRRKHYRREGSNNRQRLTSSLVDVDVSGVWGIQDEGDQSDASNLTASELTFDVSELTMTLQSDQQAASTVERESTMAATYSGDETTKVIIGSPPTSTDCAVRGLSEVDEKELDAFSLSSGEEEEVRWGGGGRLSAPIIFPLPKPIIQRALNAAEVLRRERLSSKTLESKVQGIAASMRRTARILREPHSEFSSRMKSLCNKNDAKELKQYLKERHVNASRLNLASVAGLDGAQQSTLRRVSTAPALGHCRQRPGSPWRLSSDLEQSSCSSQVGVLGWNDGPSDDYYSSVTVSWPTGQKIRPPNLDTSIETCAQEPGQSAAHGREGYSVLRMESPAILIDPAAAGLEAPASDWSTTSSLHASVSSMSSRAHARAMASCRVATRRPYRHGRGKLLLPDPSTCAQVRENAVCLVQAALLGVHARSLVRKLREQRAQAATTISRIYRGWRMRTVLKLADLKKRAGRLEQRMRIRKRHRAALSITILFRDIIFKRRRARNDLFLRDRDHIISEFQQQTAAIAIQYSIRRFQASLKAEVQRRELRGHAQAKIALALRGWVASLRQKRDEEVLCEKETAASGEIRKASSPDEAALRIQAWLRSFQGKRAAKIRRKVATEIYGPWRACYDDLRAALGALDDARLVAH